MNSIVPKEYDHWKYESTKKQVRHLGWYQIDELVDTLEKKIRKANQHYELIVGVARGGLVPAVMLSHRLNLPMMAITPRTLIPIAKRCLVIDEIYDSGDTIKQIREVNPGIHVGVLFHNEALPDLEYFATKDSLKQWIVFPWENYHEKAS
jgi:uncharacterized protein